MADIETGGGAYIGGNVNTGGGDFHGRNSYENDGIIDNAGNLLSHDYTSGIKHAYGMRWRLKQPVEKRLDRFVYEEV